HPFQHRSFRAGYPRRRLFLRAQTRALARDWVGCVRSGGPDRLPFLGTHLVCLVWDRLHRVGALFSPAFPSQDQWFLALAAVSFHHLSAVGIRQDGRSLFSRLVVLALRGRKQTALARVPSPDGGR